MLRYVISPGMLTAFDGVDAERLIAKCAKVAQAGADFLLLREKRLTIASLALLTRRVVAACEGSGTRVLVPGSPEAAFAGRAHGVHLSAHGGEPRAVRAAMPNAWISVSCHKLAEVKRARETGADAVLFAPVFGKMVEGVEVVRGVGLERLREACAAAGEMAVFALGGVNEGNAAACMDAGAAGVAGIRMFWDEG